MEELRRALDVMYTDPDPLHKAQANKWLYEHQRSMDAWNTSNQLLLSSTPVPTYVEFFAAQTLQTKIRYDFHELPKDSWNALRDSILNHLRVRCTTLGEKSIRTQLCLAVTALAIQMETWENIISDLITELGLDALGGKCLLEILTVLPEECLDAHYSSLSDERQKKMETECRKNGKRILEILVTLMQCASVPKRQMEMQNMVFRCLQSWIYCCKLSAHDVASNAVVQSLFQAIQDPCLFDAAVDAAVSLFRMYDTIATDMVLIQSIVPHVMTLQPLFQQAVENSDTDTCVGLARIFSEMAESYTELIIGPHEMNQGQIMELLLRCMVYPEHDVTVITIQFWYRYTDGLRQLPDDVKRARVTQHVPFLNQLATTCT